MRPHEIEFATFEGTSHTDLMPFQYGREVCNPGHAFGPARRSHYLFHYIIAGSGSLASTGLDGQKQEFDLAAGMGFLIFPGQITTYIASLTDPWEYIWLEFDGARVKDVVNDLGLSIANPIYRPRSPELRDELVGEMRYLLDHKAGSPLALVAHTYLFLDALARSAEPHRATGGSRLIDYYIREARTFVERRYQDDVTVEDIARHLGLNRSYFGKVFKTATGISPQRYLIGYRMDKAAELLKLSALSVAEVGRAVGYPNQLHFSRAFKNEFGMSPRAWRKANLA